MRTPDFDRHPPQFGVDEEEMSAVLPPWELALSCKSEKFYVGGAIQYCPVGGAIMQALQYCPVGGAIMQALHCWRAIMQGLQYCPVSSAIIQALHYWIAM